MRKAVLIVLSAGLSACGAPGLPPAGAPTGEVDVGYGTQPAANVTGRVTTITERADPAEQRAIGHRAAASSQYHSPAQSDRHRRRADAAEVGDRHLPPE